MPEGDTLFKIATALGRALVGHKVSDADTRRPAIRAQLSHAPLLGREVINVEARGKHLLIQFDDGRCLLSHLRMHGSWHLYREGETWRRPPRFADFWLTAGGHVAVCYQAPVVTLTTTRTLGRGLTSRLGPDATADGFDEGEALRRLRERPEVEIGPALLDQRALAGIGNVIKAEALFLQRVHPRTPVAELSDAALVGLIREGHKLLLANRTLGGRVSRRALTGPKLWVYGRRGKPCLRCGTVLEQIHQQPGPRVSCYCPRCQQGSPLSL